MELRAQSGDMIWWGDRKCFVEVDEHGMYHLKDCETGEVTGPVSWTEIVRRFKEMKEREKE